jgi:pyruvate dehydrogenase E2 component (dihydrolipoamide acetyltransferase)
MAAIDIAVPDIGDFDEVTVIELLVKPGDTIKADQSLLTVESDKASMEIPSSHAGVVKAVKVALGDKVKQGSVVLSLETAEEADSAQSAPKGEKIAASEPISPKNTAAAQSIRAQPAIDSVAAPAAASGSIAVHVPDIGDFKDVTVIEVLVKVGDSIKVEQSLITVESDKASMEIPSSSAGVLKEIKVKLGDKINIGDLLAVVEGSAPAAASATASTPAPQPAPQSAPIASAAGAPAVAAPAHNPTEAPTGALPHASPSVRKFARELGVPLAEVKGAGPKGRITVDDVQAFTKSVMSGAVQTQAIAVAAPKASGGGDGAGLGLLPWPKVDFTKFGAVEVKPLSRIKKISGANLHRNWVMIPHVTNHDDADITDLEAFRVTLNKENEKVGKGASDASVKVTMLAFVIKACVAAMKKFPDFNASLEGDTLVYKKYFHIGFAADTPNGLTVPVIRDADQKSIMQISQELADLSKKAREGKLSPAEMTGGCFSISSLGGIGGNYFAPIINAPEVAIMGLGKSANKPVWSGSAFVPRLMMPMSLSYDHRVIDGASAARFNAYLGQLLADFRRVSL